MALSPAEGGKEGRPSNQFLEVNGRAKPTRRPSSHTVRCGMLGLVSPADDSRSVLSLVTPGEVAAMSPKERARLIGEVERARRASRISSRLSVVAEVELDSESFDGSGSQVSIDAPSTFGGNVSGDVLVGVWQDPSRGETIMNHLDEDPMPLDPYCIEQSLDVAGIHAVEEQGMHVEDANGELVYGEDVSGIYQAGAQEDLEEWQGLFDEVRTAMDLRNQ